MDINENYILAGISWLGVGLSMEEGLQTFGALLAVISSLITLLITLIKFGKLCYNKIKKILEDKKITKEEKEELKNIINDNADKIKNNINNVKENINNFKEKND